MLIREKLEQDEEKFLSPYASLSKNSKGRVKFEEQCDIRTIYQRDRDRIIHSKAFRRLKDKTQVFLTPDGDHYRTRLTHTLEVSQNARTIAKALRLNEDLVEAIALGHDLGHTPFGHSGERALNAVCPSGFEHNVQSVRCTELYEREGQGLNLTLEVKDGILNHQTDSMPFTLEGKIVRLSDKIAYIHHDCDDAIRAGILKEKDFPREVCEILGYTTGERLDTLIHDIITNSYDADDIRMSESVERAMKEIRLFMFERVYTNEIAKSQEGKAVELVKTLYCHYLENFEKLPLEMLELAFMGHSKEQLVCDYIAGMTDRFAIAQYEEIFIPQTWHTGAN